MKILNCIPFTKEQKYSLERIPDTEFIYCDKNKVSEEIIRDVEIIMGNVPVSLLRHAKQLRWVQLNSAGANPYCVKGALPEGVLLTNAAGAYGISVSEHMLALTLAMIKNLYQYQENQVLHRWKDEGPVLTLKDARVLVLGMGDIGCAYARGMKALGSYIIGVRKHADKSMECFDEVIGVDELDRALNSADITAITLPGTTETIGMFDESRLRQMKRGSYLLNVGRGNIIDHEALEKIMQEGYLSGVSLDVVEPEPLPIDSPMWSIPNLYITPHVAGGFHIPITLQNICTICCENLENYKMGRELCHLVDKKKQY